MQRILEGMDEYLFRMYDGLLKELKQTECYRNDSDEADRLEERYPEIRQILEGADIRKERVLSVEVQTAIKEFVEHRTNMLDDLQVKYYLRGVHDCILLMVKCGLLNQNEFKGDDNGWTQIRPGMASCLTWRLRKRTVKRWNGWEGRSIIRSGKKNGGSWWRNTPVLMLFWKEQKKYH